MKYYAVIDTNVLVSALLSVHDDAATVLLVSKMLSGEIVPIYNSDIINEYGEVLNRRKFNFDKKLTEHLLSAVCRFGLFVERAETGVLLPDIKDLPFYEVVMEKRKSDDAYLVTGNVKHFPIEAFIVTPNEMLRIMQEK
ncbi:MAG: PIN domain-containing protein [Clostridia bacterium]|nr:PIN domain-containing protein [Clostridia bacterium]